MTFNRDDVPNLYDLLSDLESIKRKHPETMDWPVVLESGSDSARKNPYASASVDREARVIVLLCDVYMIKRR